jgi:hypothetical protein
MIFTKINNNKNKDLKYNNTIYDIKCLITLCKEYNIILWEDYSNKNITRDSIIKGKCNKKDCNNTFQKTFRALNNEKTFYCDDCLKGVINKRKINTFIKNYGVSNPFKSEIIKKKKIIKKNMVMNIKCIIVKLLKNVQKMHTLKKIILCHQVKK